MLEQVISLSWGLLSLSREKAETFMKEMIKKGELSRENGKYIFRALMERGARERAAFKEDMNSIICKLLQKGIFATRSELKKLEERVNKIEESFNKAHCELSGDNREKGL